MTSVEIVKALCKERKISVHKLEVDLGFGNGYIGQLRKGMFPADRLAKIADYFGVTTEFLLGQETKKAPTPEGECKVSDDELKFALWGDVTDITDDDLDDVRRYAAFIKERKKRGHE